MADELVQRLRAWQAGDRDAHLEAADALARKDAEIAELRRTIAQDHEATLLRDRALRIASEKCVAADSQLAALRSLLGEARNYLEGLDIADKIDALVALEE